MKPSELKPVLTALVEVQRPVVVESEPGVGKTDLFRQIAKDLHVKYANDGGFGYIEMNLPTKLVDDFGLPMFYKDDATSSSANGPLQSFAYAMPDWFPSQAKVDAGLIPARGMLCFDDRNQGTADLQKVIANIQHSRNLHGVPLARQWSVVATGNRKQDRAGSVQVLTHLRNRETRFDYEVNLDDWCSWAADNDMPIELISFIRMRPELLSDFDPNADVNATPRSWADGVGRLMNIIPQGSEYEVFKGSVGEGKAAEFTGYLKIFRNLPPLDGIVSNPTSAQVPSDPATLYALAGALAKKATTKTFGNILKYVERIPGDIGVLLVSYAIRNDDSLTSVPEFSAWAVQNQDLLF